MTEVIVWNGWIGGLGIGLYVLFQLVVTGKMLGVSSGYCSLCGCFSRATFFIEQKQKEGPLNWRLWFIFGLPLGGLLAAWSSPGDWVAGFSLGKLYDSVFPDALWAKSMVLVVGGLLMGLGARMAGGCTSGHAISGMAMLNPPSIVAAAGFFAGGVFIVQLLFRMVG